MAPPGDSVFLAHPRYDDFNQIEDAYIAAGRRGIDRVFENLDLEFVYQLGIAYANRELELIRERE